MPRKVAFLGSAVFARENGTKQSRLCGRLPNSKLELKPSPVGLRKLFSMK